MAQTVRIQEDGPRNAVLWIDEDGSTPTTSGTIITPGQLGFIDTARQLRARNLRIDKIEWDINGEDASWVELIWNGSGGTAPAYHMVGRANKYFKDFGGLYPPLTSVPATGSLTGINFATNTSFTGTYTIILYLVKTQ